MGLAVGIFMGSAVGDLGGFGGGVGGTRMQPFLALFGTWPIGH